MGKKARQTDKKDRSLIEAEPCRGQAGGSEESSASPQSSVFNMIFKSLPVIGVVITVIILIIIGKQLTLDDIMRFRMDNAWLASAYLICAYAVKSILIVVPLNLLMIAGGMFFDSQWLSLCVNTIGVAVCLCIPYWLGRLIGKRAADKFIENTTNAASFRKSAKFKAKTASLFHTLCASSASYRATC